MDNTQQEIEATLGIGKGRRRPVGWLILAFCVALGAVAWIYMRGADGGSGAPQFTTEPVRRGSLIVSVTATGSVEPTNLVDISSELSGTLAAVLVDFNDTVVAGQVLARLDTSKLEAQVAVQRANLHAAEARSAAAQASAQEAVANYDMTRELDQRGVASHQALTTASATLERARAELKVAQAEVAQATANLNLAETELAKACICSPIDGVILDRQADAGQIVAASLSAPVLFTVAEDLTKMELQVAVDEADIGRLTPGNHATFTVDAYDDREFPAEIASIRYAPQTVDGVVTYLAILTLDNGDLSLRPGMTATAEIIVREIADTLLVPNAALRFAPRLPEDAAAADDGPSGLLGMIMPHRPADATMPRSLRTVWVLRDGAAVEVDVDPGDSDGRLTEIRSGGLAEGDRVIIGQAD